MKLIIEEEFCEYDDDMWLAPAEILEYAITDDGFYYLL